MSHNKALAGESELRDLLSEEDYQRRGGVKIVAESVYSEIISSAVPLARSVGPSKNIIEVQNLIKKAIEDYDKRTHANKDARVIVTYDSVDRDFELETITFCITKRSPGAFSQGAPFEGKTRNLRPILREEEEDPDNQGYRRAMLGYFYDNIIRLTCWARTNKAADERALWLENVMEEYQYFFAASGVNRILFWGRAPEIVREGNNNWFYGRQVDYFVRTEKIRAVSQKEIEEIFIRLQPDVSSE